MGVLLSKKKKMAWYEHFDVQKHAVHKADPKSYIFILTQHKESDEKRLKDLNVKEARFNVIDITNHDDQALFNAINSSEPLGSPTNVILNYEDANSASREKLNQLFDTLSLHLVLQPKNVDNFKFIELRETWLSSQHGAYLMSSVQNTGLTWKDKIEQLCTSKIIGKDQQYKILLFSGTHGKINPDGTISVSGFSDDAQLEKPGDNLCNNDKQTAEWLENKMRNNDFKICITVVNMRDFSKP